MKVTVESLPESSVSIDILAEEDEFAKAMDRAFRRVSQQVTIRGFRPGKAPRAVVERRIGHDAIVEEANRELMDKLYQQALEQENIVPVSQPDVEIYQPEPVGFKVQIQVYPTVDLGDYKDVRVEPRDVTVIDADIDEQVKELQLSNSTWVEPDPVRSPQDGDQVTVNLNVSKEGEPFGEVLENAVYVIGESALFEQIEDALKHLQPGGEAQFSITFAEDDEKVGPELRGNTLDYDLKLLEVKERELPEIDDELAKTTGDYGTLDALKDAIRDSLLKQRAVEARDGLITEAIEKMAEGAVVSVPSAMVDREIESRISQMRQRLQQSGASFEEYLRFEGKSEDEYKEEEREPAAKRVRNSLVMESFAKAEEIDVSDDDLAEEIDRMVGAFGGAEDTDGAERDQIRQLYQSNEYLHDALVDRLTNQKITDRLIELTTDGRGALLGEGADAYEALMNPPAPETTEFIGPSGEDESEAVEVAEDATTQVATSTAAVEQEVDVETEAFGLNVPTEDADVLGDEGGAGVTQVAEAIDVDENDDDEDDTEQPATEPSSTADAEQP